MKHRVSSWLGSAVLLGGLGGSPLWPPQPAFAAAESPPCSASAEARQLDYWVGDWTVTYPGAQGSGTSKVYLSLDQCLLIETWESGTGLKGQNMFAYNSEDRRWRGLYVDNHGRVHTFEGRVTPGSAEFLGRSRSPAGRRFLNRVKVVRITPDSVEQSWEKSTDGGSTWEMAYRGEYSRKPSTP